MSNGECAGKAAAQNELAAALYRLEHLGRALNAVVTAIPHPPRTASGPLVGTPVAVKDIIAVAGYPRGNGNPEDMAGTPSPVDAPVIARFRAAGADIFALTSLLEYAAGAPHPDLPEARNPMRPDRTAGGSSGGSAAVVGAGVCRVALGTDTGGSVRIPAAYCGVVGFKPTYGLVSTEGVTPLSPTLDHVGLITATVQDCLTILPVIAPTLAPPDTAGATPDGVRLGILEDQFADLRIEPEIAAISRDAVARLADAGFALESRNAGPLSKMGDLLGPILMVEAWQVHSAAMTARPEHFGSTTRRLLDDARHASPEARLIALQHRDDLLPAVDALFTAVDALVGPVAPYAAPEFTPPVDTPAGEIEGIFTGPYNVTGHPAVVIPCGRTHDGLPVGLQFAGRHGDDAALLRLAARAATVLASPS